VRRGERKRETERETERQRDARLFVIQSLRLYLLLANHAHDPLMQYLGAAHIDKPLRDYSPDDRKSVLQ
jgi:hypothetical protein